MRRTVNAIILVSFLIAALVGCGGGGGGGGGGSITDVTLNRTNVSVAPGGTIDFTANMQVNWGVAEGNTGGTFNPTTGTTSVYTAPNTTGTFHIQATSVADPTKSATAVVTVQTAANVVVQPDAGNLEPGETLQFTANVPVNWSIQEGNAGGTFTSTTNTSAVYKAPSVEGTFHVIATSKADSTKKATVTIRVENLVPPPPPPL